MTTEMQPEADPQSNLIEFDPGKRKGSLVPVRAPYGGCKHERVFANQETRSINCQTCDTALDLFDFVWELATKQRRWLEDLDSWDAERESRLSDRYDAEWARVKNHILSPPSDPETRKIWDTFEAYLGARFLKMYRRKQRLRAGPSWYGVGMYGVCVSYEYARQQLIPKAVKP